MSESILKLRSKHFQRHAIKVVDACRIATLCADSVRLLNGKAVKMDVVINLQRQDIVPPFTSSDDLPELVHRTDLAYKEGSHIWMAVHSDNQHNNVQRRLSMQLEQARLAGFNAWANSQSLPVREVKKVSKSLYECYMGRHTVATWRGLALPGAVGWMLNRRRYLSTLPSLERKLRILIDWTLDFVFNHDTAGLLEYDYQLKGKQAIRAVPNAGNEDAVLAIKEQSAGPHGRAHKKAA